MKDLLLVTEVPADTVDEVVLDVLGDPPLVVEYASPPLAKEDVLSAMIASYWKYCQSKHGSRPECHCCLSQDQSFVL